MEHVFHTGEGKTYGIRENYFFYEDMKIPIKEIKKIFIYKGYIVEDITIYLQCNKEINFRIWDESCFSEKAIDEENEFEEIAERLVNLETCVDI